MGKVFRKLKDKYLTGMNSRYYLEGEMKQIYEQNKYKIIDKYQSREINIVSIKYDGISKIALEVYFEDNGHMSYYSDIGVLEYNFPKLVRVRDAKRTKYHQAETIIIDNKQLSQAGGIDRLIRYYHKKYIEMKRRRNQFQQ